MRRQRTDDFVDGREIDLGRAVPCGRRRRSSAVCPLRRRCSRANRRRRGLLPTRGRAEKSATIRSSPTRGGRGPPHERLGVDCRATSTMAPARASTPHGAGVYARHGDDFPVQRWRVGARGYAFQFHPEVTYAMTSAGRPRAQRAPLLAGSPRPQGALEGPLSDPTIREVEGLASLNASSTNWLAGGMIDAAANGPRQ